jgi:hypothetical protein
VRRADAELAGDALERWPRPDPELADRGVGVELGRRPVGALAQVQRDVVARLTVGSNTSTESGTLSLAHP